MTTPSSYIISAINCLRECLEQIDKLQDAGISTCDNEPFRELCQQADILAGSVRDYAIEYNWRTEK